EGEAEGGDVATTTCRLTVGEGYILTDSRRERETVKGL
ncbi:hypothetical protein A2U01_0106803, partial [Trifolium medium]|nr:hypothetical protein [Trifolium medium]